MTCGCKHKRGSGGAFLSGVTWHGYPKGMIVRKTGKGMRFSGTGAFRKRRRKKKGSGMCGRGMFSYQGSCHPTSGGGGIYRKRRKKKKGGMSMTGGGVNFSGGAINDAMRIVLNRVRLNRFRRP